MVDATAGLRARSAECSIWGVARRGSVDDGEAKERDAILFRQPDRCRGRAQCRLERALEWRQWNF
jgi:hypothetical protein